jgi:hypothetical protein
MEAIALWHREGMSSSFGGSVSCRTFVARDEVGVLSGVSERGLHFTGFSLSVWLCHRSNGLSEFVVCV